MENKVVERNNKNKTLKVVAGVSLAWSVFFMIVMVNFAIENTQLRNEFDAYKEKVFEEFGHEPELLDCPLCGYEVDLKPIGEKFYIECDNFNKGKEGCGLKTAFYSSKSELI